MDITWIGQGGFIFEIEGYRLVIDPYLSDNLKDKGGTRMIPPPVNEEQLRPDALFFTHDHLDHFDEFTVLPVCKLYPECLMLGPNSVSEHIKKIKLTNPAKEFFVGDQFNAGPFSLTIVPAYHSDPSPVGVILGADGFSVYVSGDSKFEPELISNLKKASPENLGAVIICINGKLNNMSWQEAAKVIDALKPKVAIPMHYGMFYENTIDPSDFLSTCKEMGYHSTELIPGRTESLKELVRNSKYK